MRSHIQQDFEKEAVLKKFNIPRNRGEKNVDYFGFISDYYTPEILVPPLKTLIDQGFTTSIRLQTGAYPTKIAKQATNAGGKTIIHVAFGQARSQTD